uniref:Uncharacterized protein n=1 Tax=Arundo donax TaxID=35708 RepID=A0A0A8YPM4_ARUDO
MNHSYFFKKNLHSFISHVWILKFAYLVIILCLVMPCSTLIKCSHQLLQLSIS